MGNLKKLTPKQIKFALLIVTKGDRMTAADCAIEAGYSEKAANQIASNLQSPKMFPLVVEEIDRLRKEWHIPFKFPNEIETFVYETNIIKLVKSDG